MRYSCYLCLKERLVHFNLTFSAMVARNWDAAWLNAICRIFFSGNCLIVFIKTGLLIVARFRLFPGLHGHGCKGSVMNLMNSIYLIFCSRRFGVNSWLTAWMECNRSISIMACIAFLCKAYNEDCAGPVCAEFNRLR